MPLLRAAVGLVAAPGTDLSQLHNANWYRVFFFSLTTGIAGFWFDQTDGDFWLQGEVIGWKHFAEEPDYDNRAALVDAGRRTIASDLVPFGSFNHFLIVVAPPGGRGINAGSIGAPLDKSSVFRVGQEFDYHAHEVGHVFGLKHSFDTTNIRWDPSAQPGEYGNPYCIMSAQAYGAGNINNAAPLGLPPEPEYTHYGPRYSTASQAARNYIRVIDVALPTANRTRAVILKSAGSPGRGEPKAARIRGTDGGTYVISYRNPRDPFDSILPGPAVVIEMLEGGQAERSYPGIHAATFVTDIKLPLTYNAPGATYQGPGFAVSVIDWEKDDNGAVWLEISQRAPDQVTLTRAPKIELLDEIFDNGTVHFETGEYICVGGTYDWTLRYQEFGLPLEVSVDCLDTPMIEWKIEVHDVKLPAETLYFFLPTIGYPPLPYGSKSTVRITIRHEHPAPEVLTIYNRGTDGVYDLNITCTVKTRVGSVTLTERLPIAGQVLSMPQFEEDRDRCIVAQHIRDRRFVQVQILLPGDIWRRPIDDRTREKVSQLVNLAAAAYGRDQKAFEEYRGLTARALGVADVAFAVREPRKAVQRKKPDTAATRRPRRTQR